MSAVEDSLETQARIGALRCEGGPHSPTGHLLRQLADEIERLRAECNALRDKTGMAGEDYYRARFIVAVAERDALREKIDYANLAQRDAENELSRQMARAAMAETQLRAECYALRAEVARQYGALTWALGCNGYFREQRTMEGAYWWRGELAERAGLFWNGQKYVSRPIDAALGEESRT